MNSMAEFFDPQPRNSGKKISIYLFFSVFQNDQISPKYKKEHLAKIFKKNQTCFPSF
jgi:hypothetical protein